MSSNATTAKVMRTNDMGNGKTQHWIHSGLTVLQKELNEHPIYESVISPLVKRIMWMLLPYGICFVLLNFFTTLLAVGTVLYIWGYRK